MKSGEHRLKFPSVGMICVHLFFLLVLATISPGCTARPNQANIELRKQIQTQTTRIADLDRRHEADQATIRSLQSGKDGATPNLPPERIEKLFTAHGISLGRLTGASEFDANASGDDGVKVYVVPVDQSGEKLKAAGAFVVELFDLNMQQDTRIGKWEFSVDQAKRSWFGEALLYTYVLTCPWQAQRPAHDQLTLKVTFTDELIGREFSVQKVITVKSNRLPSAPAGEK